MNKKLVPFPGVLMGDLLTFWRERWERGGGGTWVYLKWNWMPAVVPLNQSFLPIWDFNFYFCFQ